MAVYIVFDVETPNRSNDRMSAIGITAIKDNEIVANCFSLVDSLQKSNCNQKHPIPTLKPLVSVDLLSP